VFLVPQQIGIALAPLQETTCLKVYT